MIVIRTFTSANAFLLEQWAASRSRLGGVRRAGGGNQSMAITRVRGSARHDDTKVSDAGDYGPGGRRCKCEICTMIKFSMRFLTFRRSKKYFDPMRKFSGPGRAKIKL